MGAYLQSLGQLSDLLARQRQTSDREGAVSVGIRRKRIQAVIDLLVDEHQALAEAMDEDFGGRHVGFGLMNDVLGSLSSLKHCRDHLESWMARQTRKPPVPYDQLGAEAWVQYQPKGTVGVIGTWNAPLFTLFSPLASAYAAGNRVVLKPSEVTPKTAELLARAIDERFDPMDLAVITGGPEVGQGFASQPFGHLVFTGSTSVGREIMRRAADNLVPVTLELGGKSPVIISRQVNLAEAARRLAIAKGSNGGQLCISPDRVYVPAGLLEQFLAEFASAFRGLYPSVENNSDLVSVVNDRHLNRIEDYLAEARKRGAKVITCPDAPSAGRKRPLSLVVNPPSDTRIMQEEIFGPAMLVLSYESLDEALAEINGGERPLALYYFGDARAEQEYVLERTLSGGVTLNDALMHAAMEEAPFGGVGASGMGHYHGMEGFREFSHARTVFRGAPVDPRGEWGLLPPWPDHFYQAMASQITRD
ncbi:coniferyl aldehyde dehydrogenase [Proteobacteria bacterium 005FR1]|nr:coniferyl aldehyde dehydrogenase [Proteobacteria bacterium 005FR1]